MAFHQHFLICQAQLLQELRFFNLTVNLMSDFMYLSGQIYRAFGIPSVMVTVKAGMAVAG